MHILPYSFLILIGGLSLAMFLTSQTFAAEAVQDACALKLLAL